jgi:uncharacterized protein with GYD domain
MAFYVLNAQYTSAGLRKLASRDISNLKEDLDRAAQSSGGRLVDLFIVSGDFRLVVLFDFRRGPGAHSLSALMFSVTTSGLFEPGARLSRLETPEALDEALREKPCP